MNRFQDMTKGRPVSLIVSFAIPMMLGDLLQQAYTLADSAVIGRMLGTTSFAAVNASSFFYWFILMIVQGFSHGFEVLMAQLAGSKKQKVLNQAFLMSLYLMVIISVVLSVAALIILRPTLILLNTPDELLDEAAAYTGILLCGIMITFVYNVFGSYFRANGDSRTPLFALLISSVVNIALDILLVRFTSWGVAAVAIATLLAQLCATLFCLYRFGFRNLKEMHFKFDPVLTGQLFRLGLPIGLRDCIAAVGGAVIQYYINRYGIIFVAGVAAAKKVYSLLFVLGNGFSVSAGIFIAQNYGAKEKKRIQSGTSAAFRLILASSVLVVGVMLIAREPLVRMMLENDASQDAVVEIAMEQLSVCYILLPLLYLTFFYRSLLQGLGNTVAPMFSGLIEITMRVLTVVTLPSVLGRYGVYIAEPAGWPIMAIYLFVAWRMTKKRKLQFEQEKGADRLENDVSNLHKES